MGLSNIKFNLKVQILKQPLTEEATVHLWKPPQPKAKLKSNLINFLTNIYCDADVSVKACLLFSVHPSPA